MLLLVSQVAVIGTKETDHSILIALLSEIKPNCFLFQSGGGFPAFFLSFYRQEVQSGQRFALKLATAAELADVSSAWGTQTRSLGLENLS